MFSKLFNGKDGKYCQAKNCENEIHLNPGTVPVKHRVNRTGSLARRAQSQIERLHLFNFSERNHSAIEIRVFQGKCFVEKLFKELLAFLDKDKSSTTPYHPQCEGHTGRFNRTLEEMIDCFI